VSNAKAEAELEKVNFPYSRVFDRRCDGLKVDTCTNDISERMTPTVNTGEPSLLSQPLHPASSRMFTAVRNILTTTGSGKSLHSDVPTLPSVTGIYDIGYSHFNILLILVLSYNMSWSVKTMTMTQYLRKLGTPLQVLMELLMVNITQFLRFTTLLPLHRCRILSSYARDMG
jgi:hypothetical protein